MGKRVQKLALKNLASKVLNLGYVGENEHTQIVIDCSEVLWDYENAVTSVVVQPPRGDMYPVEVTREDDSIIWEIADSDLVYSGTGRVQITFTNDGEVVKSAIGNTKIDPSIMATGTAPTPLENWMERAEETARQMGQDVADATLEDLAETKEECIAEIEQAGADTRATIPADYTQMSDDVSSLKSAIVKKADQAGVCPDLTAGTAEQLASSQCVEDNAAYTLRPTGGGVNVGNREYLEKIIGGTVCWNQLVNVQEKSGASKDVDYVISSDGTVTLNGIASEDMYVNVTGVISVQSGHKALIFGCPSGGSPSTYYVRNGYTAGSSRFDTGNGNVFEVPANGALYQINVKSGTTVTNLVFKPQIFDLTAIFGPTIADYVYNLEQTTAGAGVAWFRRYFPNNYYEYNPGELISVSGLQSHDTVGFNAWDEEWELGSISSSTGNNIDSTSVIRSKNYIPVIPGAKYYIKTSGKTLGMRYYDANKKYLTYAAVAEGQRIFAPNVRYIRFYVVNTTVYNHDVCINLSHSGTRNGEYEPCEKHSYPLDPSVTLRGMPKLDENENLYFDGDEYPPDGIITRKWVENDLPETGWQTRFTGSVNKALSLQGFIPAYSALDPCPFMSEKYNIIRGIQGVSGINEPDSKDVGLYWYNNPSTYAGSTSSIIYLVLPVNDVPSGKIISALADPTTEQAEPYTEIQVCSDWGTEEFVTDSILPVGHLTRYPANLRDKLQHLPSLADADGDYIVRQNGSQMSLVGLGNTDEIAGIKDDIYGLRATASAQGIYVETESQPIVSISDGADDQPMKAAKVAIEPVQDLHGYEYPWPAGGGVNILPTQDGTWFTSETNNIFLTESGFQLPAGTYNAKIFRNKTSEALAGFYVSTNGESYERIGSNSSDSEFVRSFTVEASAQIDLKLYCSTAGFDNAGYRVVLSTADITNSAFAPYSNVCPISGWTGAKVTRCGKNLFDIGLLNLSPVTVVDGVATGTAGNFTTTFGGGIPNLNIPKNTQLTLSFDAKTDASTSSTGNGLIFRFNYSDGTQTRKSVPNNVTEYERFTLTSDASKVISNLVISHSTSGPNIWYVKNVQLEIGSTATSYEQYLGNTYEVTFPADPGTVYGGTLDVVSGKLVVDRTMVNAKDVSWSNTGTNGIYHVFSDKVQDTGTAISSHFVPRTYSNSNRIAWVDDAIERADKLAILNNGDVQICYLLASPITYQLTTTEITTLLGINNVFADCGDTAITYPADTKMYIDNRINSTRRLIAGIETGFTASKAYSVGDMLIIGDDLYKVASSIASGATITVGTNVTKTTVAEQLLALANA